MRRLALLFRGTSLSPALLALISACAGSDAGDNPASFGPGTASDSSSDDSSVDGDSSSDGSASMTGDPTTSTTMTTTTADDTSSGECMDGETRDCYSGPAGTQNVGICAAGTESCVGGMWSGQCMGEETPGIEMCNGVDENCNGMTDEGLNAGACNTGLAGPCATGVSMCTEGAMMCVPDVEPVAEVCGDGIDQNCNGTPDDGCMMSCPFVYGHDGRRWHYEGAVGGASLIGRPEQVERGRGKRVEFAPLAVPLASAAVQRDHDGRGRARALLLVGEDEIAYVDRLALAVVEHARGTEVVASSALQWSASQRAERAPFIALPTAGMRTPDHASWRGRVDVTEAIARRDDHAVAFDCAHENFYELDFGEVEHTDAAIHLVVDGWKLKHERALGPDVRRRRPFVQVQRADGAWHTVMQVPSPRGDRKTVAIDLSAVRFDGPRYRVRLWTGTHEGGLAMWYVDRVRLCVGAPSPVQVASLSPASARLHFAGAPSGLDDGDRAQPRWNVPDGRGELTDAQCTYGDFTAYGEVAPLLDRADDCVVVMRRGDAIELEFEGIAAPDEGRVQTLWLDSELLYKPRVVPGTTGDSSLTRNVGPLPHRGMGHYRGDAPPRRDLAYLAYQRRWNTRRYEPGSTHWGESRHSQGARRRAVVTALAVPLAA
ncbi:MAG: hypothetical protein KBB21_22870 [Nannocystaceae bacterium]|nr:hypothetical protein [Deltaproteobacteria bacterium]MBP7289490.1 hypothetical protein [Nannocystaceae bacterium]